MLVSFNNCLRILMTKINFSFRQKQMNIEFFWNSDWNLNKKEYYLPQIEAILFKSVFRPPILVFISLPSAHEQLGFRICVTFFFSILPDFHSQEKLGLYQTSRPVQKSGKFSISGLSRNQMFSFLDSGWCLPVVSLWEKVY